MRRFEWNSCLETGDAIIDSQHKRLLELASTFNEEIKHGGESGISLKLIEDLAHYATSHFQYEEGYYRDHHLETLSSHIQLHEDLKKKLAMRILSIKNGQVPLKADLAIFVHDWIIHHIMEQDLVAISHCRHSSK